MTIHVIRTEEDKFLLSQDILKLPLRKPKQIKIETYDQRTVEQNRQQWPFLFAFSQQKTWEVNGVEAHLEPEEWKDLLSAAWKKETIRMARNLDGDGFVMLGLRTSKIPAEQWDDWMAFLKWAAAEYQVKVPLSKRQAEAYSNLH